jgi:hypothetical protein
VCLAVSSQQLPKQPKFRSLITFKLIVFIKNTFSFPISYYLKLIFLIIKLFKVIS